MDAFNVYTSRFLEVIDSLKISDYQVWNNLESLSKGTMSKIRCGRVGVSMNVLYEFCNKYNVNAIIFLQERVRCLNLSQHHPIQNQKLIKHPHRTKLKQKILT